MSERESALHILKKRIIVILLKYQGSLFRFGASTLRSKVIIYRGVSVRARISELVTTLLEVTSL